MTNPEVESMVEQRPAVRGFVLGLVRNEALADDLTQETFVRAQQTASPYRGEASHRSWLCAIALNVVRDHFRAVARHPEVASNTQAIRVVASEGEGVELGTLRKEMSSCIAEYLIRLPQPQREVVALHDMAGLTHKEIAAQLDISEANARVLLHRGRAAFRKILENNCVLSLGADDIPCERRPPVTDSD
jgi:RNA polymerase sigma-70 factor (ECF subfamily)